MENTRSHKRLNSQWYITQKSRISWSDDRLFINYRPYHQQSMVSSSSTHVPGQPRSSPLTHTYTTIIKSLPHQNWCEPRKMEGMLPHRKTHHPPRLSKENSVNKHQPIGRNQRKVSHTPKAVIHGLCLATARSSSTSWMLSRETSPLNKKIGGKHVIETRQEM